MVDNLTTEQLAEFKQTFLNYDDDESGRVNIQELVKKMQPLGSDSVDHGKLEEMLTMMQRNIRSDDTSEITFPAFVSLMGSTIKDDDIEQELEKAYADVVGKTIYDPLDKNTFRRIFVGKLGEEVTDEELNRVLQVFDVDPDTPDTITLDEFKRCMMK